MSYICFLKTWVDTKMEHRWTKGRQETGARDRRQFGKEQVIDNLSNQPDYIYGCGILWTLCSLKP